jgi:hypothetical protein
MYHLWLNKKNQKFHNSPWHFYQFQQHFSLKEMRGGFFMKFLLETGKIAFAGFFFKIFCGTESHMIKKCGIARARSRKIPRVIPSRAGL